MAPNAKCQRMPDEISKHRIKEVRRTAAAAQGWGMGPQNCIFYDFTTFEILNSP